jgi:ribulose-5-phosphate 4-epimerase/fuculose-1-phosphate aldolase
MGARDVSVNGPPRDRVEPGRVDEFRSAGRILFSLRLVKDAEGNLSVFDGTTLWVTRTGVSLADLGPADVLEGRLTGDLPHATTDLEVHRRTYRERGPGALAHAHPAGTVHEERGPGEHGVYAFGATLLEAAQSVVRSARGEVEGGRR